MPCLSPLRHNARKGKFISKRSLTLTSLDQFVSSMDSVLLLERWQHLWATVLDCEQTTSVRFFGTEVSLTNLRESFRESY